MDFTQPMVYKINAFDVNNSASIPDIKIGFSGLTEFPSVISATMNIYNNNTGNIIGVAQSVNLELQPDYDTDLATYITNIPSYYYSNDRVVNGSTYYLTITVQGDSDPLTSNGSIFSCYEAPTFPDDSFNISQNQVLQQSSVKITFQYSQIDNVILNWYMCNLYNRNDELIESSDKLYDENYTYTFSGLSNNTPYYVIVYGATIDNFEFESNKRNFTIQYTQNPDSALIEVENIAEKGYIKINSNFNNIPGTLNNAVLDNGQADLRESNSNIVWNQGLQIQDNIITTKLWGKNFNNNTNILELTDSNNANNYIKISTELGNIGTSSTGNNITIEGNSVSTSILDSYNINNIYFGRYNNYLVYSDDLKTWHYAKYNSNNFEILNMTFFVSYVNNIYYTPGANSGELYYSADGQTWNKVILNDLIIDSVIYDGSKYWAFGYNGNAYSSNADFSSATINSGANYSYNKVIYQNNKFIGIKSNNKNLYYSNNGENWLNCVDENGNNIILYDERFTNIVYYNNKFVLFNGLNGGIMATYNSDNGENWSKGGNAGYWNAPGGFLSVKILPTNNCLFFISNNNTYLSLYYSFDGIKWGKLFDTAMSVVTYGLPASKIEDNELYINKTQENIFTLYYDTINFKIQARGINNISIIEGNLTNALQNVNFYDWVYVGAQIQLDAVDEDKIDTVSIYAENQGSSPGGA